MRLRYAIFIALCLLFVSCRWTEQKATQWYAKYKWLAGFNYAPSYACNQIEMWDNFNETIIDRELKWASQIGFSSLRVFLHIAPYIDHSSKFIQNIKAFLQIAKKYNHKVIPVLFDDCWKSTYSLGKQPDPVPGLHNSQWVQCPGDVKYSDTILQDYVRTILLTFSSDTTIVLWDLYNEVGNSGHVENSLPLLKKIFNWARLVNPSQPLTSGHWNGDIHFENINNYILSESDVITFHAYCDEKCTHDYIARMEIFKRPVICTEYMARPLNSKFITHLPIFKEKNVWAINWGFVFGRTQTYYPWWSKQGDPIPDVWFHDVIHANGTSFNVAETDFIKSITKVTEVKQE